MHKEEEFSSFVLGIARTFFAEMDINKDGFITADELRVHYQKNKERYEKTGINEKIFVMMLQDSLDKNRDGKIGFREYCEFLTETLNKKL